MSRTGDHFVNTAADRADEAEREAAWLREEVRRLEREVTNRDQVIGGLMGRTAAMRAANAAMAEALRDVTSYFWGTESPILTEGEVQESVEAALAGIVP